MPRQPRIPSYRHHKPSNQAVTTIDGRDYYLGRYDGPESRAEYDRLIARWIAGGRKLPGDGPADLTVVELIRDYVKFAEGYYTKNGRPTTQVNLIKRVMKDLRTLHGPEPAAAFGPLKLKALRQSWIDRGYVRRTCNGNTGVVKQMFRWAVEHELIEPGVYQALRAVRDLAAGRSAAPDREPIGPVPDEHVAAVLPLVSDPLAAVITFMDLTGARPSEALSIRPMDIDRTGPVWTYTVSPEVSKTAHHRKTRVVTIGPRAQAAIAPWLDRQPNPAGYVFRAVGAKGGRPRPHYTVTGLEFAIRRACKRAGIPHWHPNQLRHNAATRLRKQFGIDATRAILGHGSARMTEIYAEMDVDKARAIMESVG